MPALKKPVEFGYYVPKALLNRFNNRVPRSVILQDAAATLYISAGSYTKELRDAFHDPNFLKLMNPKTDRVNDEGSGCRTMNGRFSKFSEKERVRKEMGLLAARLSVDLKYKIHAYQVAAALFYLCGEGIIQIDF